MQSCFSERKARADKSDHPQFSSLTDLLRSHAELFPARPALAGINLPPLTYAALYQQTQSVVRALHVRGLTAADRVAVVLPNGPEMAAAFLGVAAGGTCAPLNPAYRTAEFEFYLSDLKAKALLIQDGIAMPAVAAAEAQGIPILRISPQQIRQDALMHRYRMLISYYTPGTYPGRVDLIWPEAYWEHTPDPASGWTDLVAEATVHSVPGDHYPCVLEDVDALSITVRDCLRCPLDRS